MTTHTIILIISIIASIITMVTFFITAHALAHEIDLITIAHALLYAAVSGVVTLIYMTIGVAVLSWIGTQLGFAPKTDLVYLVILFILGSIGGNARNARN